jgi:hypothetical protein
VLTAEAKDCASIEGVRGDPPPAVRFVPGVGRDAFGFTLVLRLEPSADGDVVEHLVKKRIHARLVAEKIATATSLCGASSTAATPTA